MKAGSAFTAPCVAVDSTEQANMQAKKAGLFSDAGNMAGLGQAWGGFGGGLGVCADLCVRTRPPHTVKGAQT